jgi:hypothetical protein
MANDWHQTVGRSLLIAGNSNRHLGSG